jgi:phosphatidate phosphatase APP1
MDGWDNRGMRWFRSINRRFERFRKKLRRWTRIGLNRPAMVATFRGYGSPQFVHLQGRVLRDRRIYPNKEDSIFRNFLLTYRRFGSIEIPEAPLRITVGKNQFEVVSDSEGYFQLETELEHPIQANENDWFFYEVELLEAPAYRTPDKPTTGKIYMPARQADFAVISDIDDTLIHTHLTSPLKWKAIYATFFLNAETRRVVEGAASFLSALEQGPEADYKTPFFYVSNSPWNLFDLLRDFLIRRAFPKGPLLLRDLGVPIRKKKLKKEHKYQSIAKILAHFPHLPFVLIGDSGEKDALIYEKITKAFPNRIKAIYIREVKKGQVDYMKRSGVIQHPENIYWFHHFQEAIDFAKKSGLIKEK